MKKWMILLPWFVTLDSSTYRLNYQYGEVFTSMPCMPDIKEACQDMAEALNEGHADRILREAHDNQVPEPEMKDTPTDNPPQEPMQ